MGKLSICIPTYKRLDYLKPFVESIPEQYPILISDNGNYIPDDFFNRGNVRIEHLKEVVPMYENWNNAINMVETEWFIIPGDDDTVKADKLPLIEDCISKYQDCAYLAFAYDIINEDGVVTGGWNPGKTLKFNAVDGFRYIRRGVPFRWPAIVINTSLSNKVGNIDEAFTFTAGDSLYLQTLAIKYPIAIINENVGQYRVWQNSFTSERILSNDWFDQIEMWQQKLQSLIVNEGIDDIKVKRIHDQVIMDNLMVAMDLNKEAGLKEKIRLINHTGWPVRGEFRKQLRLLRKTLS